MLHSLSFVAAVAATEGHFSGWTIIVVSLYFFLISSTLVEYPESHKRTDYKSAHCMHKNNPSLGYWIGENFWTRRSNGCNCSFKMVLLEPFFGQALDSWAPPTWSNRGSAVKVSDWNKLIVGRKEWRHLDIVGLGCGTSHSLKVSREEEDTVESV